MRVCPECDRQGLEAICPACGTRTLLDVPSDAGIDPLLGRVLDGRYRLEALIGRGGMGAVYRATQIAMNKPVAVKVVKPDLAANTEAAKRFHREAKAASSLSHPHTIRVFDFGQTAERELFMVMELLEGSSLGKHVRGDGAFPAPRALKIAAEIASSLAEAHERGLVHRDLKPENVILLPLANDPDFVKVLDFGIAKFLTGSSGDSAVTRTGAVIGTPQYMAPEQARASRSLSTSADVYSLGVVLYEMLTGALPFTGDSPIDMLMAHVNDPVPELPASVDVPEDVRTLLARMLSKDPTERPTAADVARELDEIREREKALSFLARTTPAPAPALTASLDLALPAPASPHWLLLGLALLLAAGGLLAWHLLGSSTPTAAEPKPSVPPKVEEAEGPVVAPAPPTAAVPEAEAPSPVQPSPAPAIVAPAEQPAPVGPSTVEAVRPPAPGSVESSKPPAPSQVERATPAPAPVIEKPRPAAATPRPTAAKIKPARKPAPPKPAPEPPAKKADDGTPAVW